MKENSFVPGQLTQVVVALADDHAEFRNGVSVETPEPDLITWMEVAVSDDARTWRIPFDVAPILLNPAVFSLGTSYDQCGPTNSV